MQRWQLWIETHHRVHLDISILNSAAPTNGVIKIGYLLRKWGREYVGIWKPSGFFYERWGIRFSVINRFHQTTRLQWQTTTESYGLHSPSAGTIIEKSQPACVCGCVHVCVGMPPSIPISQGEFTHNAMMYSISTTSAKHDCLSRAGAGEKRKRRKKKKRSSNSPTEEINKTQFQISSLLSFSLLSVFTFAFFSLTLFSRSLSFLPFNHFQKEILQSE